MIILKDTISFINIFLWNVEKKESFFSEKEKRINHSNKRKLCSWQQ